MKDVKYYEELLKNLYGSFEAIINLAQRADDSNWTVAMDNIEMTAKQGMAFITLHSR